MKEKTLVKIQLFVIVTLIAAMFGFNLDVAGTVYAVTFIAAVVNYPATVTAINTVSAPMLSKVLSVNVKTDDAVKAGHAILQASEPVEYAGLGETEDPKLEEWRQNEARRQQALFGFWF